jgi:opacity protein-like surface antigen
MIKYLLLLLLTTATIVQGQADEFNNTHYVSAFGGVNWLHLRKGNYAEIPPGCAAAFAVGYRITPSCRIEGELGYRWNKIARLGDVKGDTQTYSCMANGYTDFDVGYWYTPYIGFGIGYAFNETTLDQSYSKRRFTDNDFASQAIVGVKAPIAEQIDLGFEYRYFVSKGNMHEQSAGLSLTYNY